LPRQRGSEALTINREIKLDAAKSLWADATFYKSSTHLALLQPGLTVRIATCHPVAAVKDSGDIVIFIGVRSPKAGRSCLPGDGFEILATKARAAVAGFLHSALTSAAVLFRRRFFQGAPMTPQTVLRTVQTETLEIAYYEYGSPAGWPVILSHGFPYDIQSYDDVAPLLAAAGARIICSLSTRVRPNPISVRKKHAERAAGGLGP
jgi:hypothetical protein